jgi:uncharacterized membrane protein YfcA
MAYDAPTILIIILATFIFKVINVTLGMGFGIGMTFTFLMLGYHPTEVVTGILIAQTIGQILAAFFHHQYRNVDYSLGGREIRIAGALILLSVIGAVLGPLVEINVPNLYLKLFTAGTIILLGTFMLLKRNSVAPFSWTKLMVTGLAAGFLKGMTGCGYGPLITSGQLLVGVEGKSAVGISMLAGPAVFAVSILTYVLTNAGIDWSLVLYMVGAIAFATPLGAFFLHRIKVKLVKQTIGFAVITMGLLIIVKCLI